MKPWKAVLAALVIFLAGTMSGGLAAHLYRVKNRQPSRPLLPDGPPAPWLTQRLELLRRLENKLDLTPAQWRRINRALQESQEHIRELWRPVAPQAQEEIRQLHRRIEAELTPAQREQFRRLIKHRPARLPAEPSGRLRRSVRPDPPPRQGERTEDASPPR